MWVLGLDYWRPTATVCGVSASETLTTSPKRSHPQQLGVERPVDFEHAVFVYDPGFDGN